MDKEIFEEYVKAYDGKGYFGSNWLKGNTFDVWKTADGFFVSVMKDRIEKSFCFSMDINGIVTHESHRDAIKQAENARTNEDYFLSENLRGVNADIQDAQDADQLFLVCDNTKRIASVKSATYFEHWMHEFERDKIVRELTAEEKQEYLGKLYNRREAFTKRLRTYLKKYGLKNLHVWTYCSD